MTNSPTISIVIPCFNHGEFLREAVDSVMRLNRSDFELIVVDDGSNDDRTPREVNELAAQGVYVIRQENRGLAAARNVAVSAARGHYIFPLDADDRIRSSWIDRGVQILNENPEIGVVYGDAHCFGARSDQWITGPFDSHRLLRMSFIHASALYRRRIWEENGGYDGKMPVQGMEDWDFYLGAMEQGWEFFYIPEVFFEYRQAEGSMVHSARRSLDAIVEYVARKHGLLYREAWLRLQNDQSSIRRTTRTLGQLLGLRIKNKLTRSA